MILGALVHHGFLVGWTALRDDVIVGVQNVLKLSCPDCDTMYALVQSLVKQTDLTIQIHL
jgi:hypothetical protein